MRDLDKLKEEKHDAVADILSASEERQIADMMTGLSNDRTSEELRELRDCARRPRPTPASVANGRHGYQARGS